MVGRVGESGLGIGIGGVFGGFVEQTRALGGWVGR